MVEWKDMINSCRQFEQLDTVNPEIFARSLFSQKALKVIFVTLKIRDFVMIYLHLRNLLTHTLLFWHFLENWNFEIKKYFGLN